MALRLPVEVMRRSRDGVELMRAMSPRFAFEKMALTPGCSTVLLPVLYRRLLHEASQSARLLAVLDALRHCIRSGSLDFDSENRALVSYCLTLLKSELKVVRSCDVAVDVVRELLTVIALLCQNRNHKGGDRP